MNTTHSASARPQQQQQPRRFTSTLRRAGAVGATAAALAAAATAAKASDFYFDVINNTNQAITQVWVSPVSSNNWGAPFTRVFVPHSGGSQRVNFSYGNAYATTCRFDVQVRFAGGQTNYWNGVDLCTVDGLSVNVVQGQVVGLTY